MLVLDGPRGSGRTRLLDETARLARRRDFTVLTGPAWTGGTGAPEIPRTGPLLFLADDPHRIGARAWSAVESFAEHVPVLVAITGLIPLPVAEVHRIRVTPLAPAAQAELVARTVGARPDPLLMDLCRVAAGRPGPLRELLAGLSERGFCGSRPAGRPSGPPACPGRSPPRCGSSRGIRCAPAPGPAAPRGPIDWSLLSSREHEIAELVGRAMTNRQIANRIAVAAYGQLPPAADLPETRGRLAGRAGRSARRQEPRRASSSAVVHRDRAPSRRVVQRRRCSPRLKSATASASRNGWMSGVGVARGEQAADVREHPADDELVPAQAGQLRGQIRTVEGAVAVFGDDQVPRPGASAEDVARRCVGVGHPGTPEVVQQPPFGAGHPAGLARCRTPATSADGRRRDRRCSRAARSWATPGGRKSTK